MGQALSLSPTTQLQTTLEERKLEELNPLTVPLQAGTHRKGGHQQICSRGNGYSKGEVGPHTHRNPCGLGGCAAAGPGVAVSMGRTSPGEC